MRSTILQLLRQQAGEPISGEEIAQRLKVSRTAVWKHIQELKQEGYAIEAQARQGYSLVETPDLLLPDEIRAVLHTRSFGSAIYYFPQIDSTNNEAKKRAAADAPEGTLIVAEEQVGGRGRLSRGWFSPFGKGIWFSVILRPPFQPQEAPKCTLMAAVAITKAIRKLTGVACGIKWPNDILYNGKKLVGILTEMSAEMDAITYVVIGMGINVNIAAGEFQPEVADVATSLSLITGQPIGRLQLFAEVLIQLEESYELVKKDGFAVILEEWRQYSATLGQMVRVIGIHRQFDGLAKDIDADGALLVETTAGIERVIAGDVSIRPKPQD